MRSLQARVRALQRILAPELAVVRLRRLSEEFCIESSVDQANGHRPTLMPSSGGPPPLASGSHPSWRSINTSRGAGTETTSPTAKTSFTPSSPGPGAIPPPPSGRDETIAQSSPAMALLGTAGQIQKLCALCALCGKNGLGKLDAGAGLTTIRFGIRRRGAPSTGAPLVRSTVRLSFLSPRSREAPAQNAPGTRAEVQEYHPCPKTRTRPNTC